MSDGEDIAGDGVLFLREKQMRLAQELMVLVWRDMSRIVAPLLEEFGLGTAQHRALQMLALHPGLTVGALQQVLAVTKQSLARTLGELQERGLVAVRQGRQDRRQRFLVLTDEGEAMEARLFAAQKERLVAAYREAGGDAVLGFRQVMRGMLSPESRAFLAHDTVSGNRGGGKARDGR